VPKDMDLLPLTPRRGYVDPQHPEWMPVLNVGNTISLILCSLS
jgi:hypothetical protein